MNFKVTRIVDGDTFEVDPNWRWGRQEGKIIRPAGYDTPEEGQAGYEEAKRRLAKLILGKEIELRNFIKITYDRLLCDVYLEDKNLKDYFPDH